MKTYQKALNT